MQTPYRRMEPRPEAPRPSRLPSVLTLVGLLGIAPVGACSGIAALIYRSEAGATAVERTAPALVENPPGLNDPIRLRATPQPSRALAVHDDALGDGELVALAESERVVLFVPGESHLATGSTMFADPVDLPPATTTDLVVHRARSYLVDETYFGVRGRDIEVYVLEDPRVGALHESRVAGIVSLAGFGVALLALPLARLLGRQRDPSGTAPLP